MSTQATAEVPAAIYARVSSDAQAQEQTIDSQVADLTIGSSLTAHKWMTKTVFSTMA